jgi:ATP-dependent exoDNAse (exonuclease V) beta subunit
MHRSHCICAKRNKRDAEWRGYMLKLHLLYLALTRATDRVYIILEDLQDEGSLTAHERPQNKEGPPLEGDSLALMKKHEYWTRLIQQGRKLWTTSLSINLKFAVATRKTTEQFIMTLPPCFKSDVFVRNITRDKYTPHALAEVVHHVN